MQQRRTQFCHFPQKQRLNVGSFKQMNVGSFKQMRVIWALGLGLFPERYGLREQKMMAELRKNYSDYKAFIPVARVLPFGASHKVLI